MTSATYLTWPVTSERSCDPATIESSWGLNMKLEKNQTHLKCLMYSDDSFTSIKHYSFFRKLWQALHSYSSWRWCNGAGDGVTGAWHETSKIVQLYTYWLDLWFPRARLKLYIVIFPLLDLPAASLFLMGNDIDWFILVIQFPAYSLTQCPAVSTQCRLIMVPPQVTIPDPTRNPTIHGHCPVLDTLPPTILFFRCLSAFWPHPVFCNLHIGTITEKNLHCKYIAQ